MRPINGKYYMGWKPDLPDFRDYTMSDTSVASIVKKTGVLKTGKSSLPKTADLRKWCSEVEDQEQLGSCTANAGVGMVEYFERKAFGKYIDASRLFLYKATRDLMHEKGDSGAELRSTMGALALFGVPPEEYWPYDIKTFDNIPPAFCYAFAMQLSVAEIREPGPGEYAQERRPDANKDKPCRKPAGHVRLYRL